MGHIEELRPGENNSGLEIEIQNALSEAKKTGDVQALSKILEISKAKVSTKNELEVQYATALNKGYEETTRFLASKDAVMLNLGTDVQNLNRVTAKADEVLNKPENRVPELLKRLALGLVVATFFFAILRYIGGLYRNQYQQMLNAEADDLAVRRFYIAYKSSDSSEEQRRSVLSSFMVGARSIEVPVPSNTSGNITKEQFDIVKEVFAALSKKL